MRSIEVNDAVDCELIIAADRLTPTAERARVCPQCGHATWSHTAACIWCGHDRATWAYRLTIAALALGSVVFFTLKAL